MTAPERIERCRFCGLLHDGEVCARCAKRGHVIVNEVCYYADGTVKAAAGVNEYGPSRERLHRTHYHNDERNAEPRS
jgi:hypothetical protein